MQIIIVWHRGIEPERELPVCLVLRPDRVDQFCHVLKWRVVAEFSFSQPRSRALVNFIAHLNRVREQMFPVFPFGQLPVERRVRMIIVAGA